MKQSTVRAVFVCFRKGAFLGLKETEVRTANDIYIYIHIHMYIYIYICVQKLFKACMVKERPSSECRRAAGARILSTKDHGALLVKPGLALASRS